MTFLDLELLRERLKSWQREEARIAGLSKLYASGRLARAREAIRVLKFQIQCKLSKPGLKERGTMRG